MLIRIIGIITGVAFLVVPFRLNMPAHGPGLLIPLLGLLFLAYGLGGQNLLRRIAPGIADPPAPKIPYDDKICFGVTESGLEELRNKEKTEKKADTQIP